MAKLLNLLDSESDVVVVERYPSSGWQTMKAAKQ